MAARQSVPVIGPQTINDTGTGSPSGESWFSPRRWQLGVGYRYQHSHRHFVGNEEQPQRAVQRSEVNNIIHVLDVGITYDVTPKFSLSVGVPIFVAKRYRQSAPEQATHADGIGDITVMARTWLLRPPSESRQNISFGLGVKLPTGRSNVKDITNAAQGPALRNVDQSIQPGDGGYGVVADFQAYKSIKKVTLYASGTYLVNPRNTNGVTTGRGRPSESIMSVADQYAYRAGAVFPFPKLNSVAWSLSFRGEGVPSKDFLGKSEGFRRPGYALSVEPGVIYTKGKDRWSLNVPVPFVRNRTRSYSDILVNGHGDAAFADYVLLVGYSRRF